MTNASDTPKVDAQEQWCENLGIRLNPWALGIYDLARTLERELAAKSAEAKRLRKALLNLADVSDDVGVMYFDGDSMPETVERMQRASIAAREALEAK